MPKMTRQQTIAYRNRPENRRGLGELPPAFYATGPLNDPGAGIVPEWYNNYTAALFPFVTGAVSQQIIPSNPLRCYLLVQNKDPANDLFLNFNQEATAFASVIIIPRGNYELIGGAFGGAFCPKSSVYVLGAAAGMNGVCVEGVLPPVMTDE